MKLLLENWREFLKEDDPSLQVLDPTGADSRVRKQMSTSIQRTAEEAGRQTAWLAAQMIDPTGITGYGDVAGAHDEWKKNPSAANSGWYVLAVVGALPLIGKLTAPLKAAKAAKKIKQMTTTITAAETTVKALKITKNADNLAVASKIEKALPGAQDAIAELRTHVVTMGNKWRRPELARVLQKMADAGQAVKYSGKAFRGLRADSLEHLLEMINVRGAAIRNMPKLEKAIANVGTQWTKLKLPGTAFARAGRNFGGVASWSTEASVAARIAHNSRLQMPYEVILVTNRGEFIDVHKTLDKAGQSVRAELQAEHEVLAIGEDIVIDYLFIRQNLGANPGKAWK